MKEERELSRDKILLNLTELTCLGATGEGSRVFSGPFYCLFDCHTKHGYMEDPDLVGEIEVVETKEEGDYVWLKTKFHTDEEDDE